MIEVLLGWLSQNYPYLFVIAIIVFLTCVVAKGFYAHKGKIDSVVNRMDKLPCEANEKVNKQILEKLNIIVTYLSMKDSKAKDLFSQKASPRKLNNEGMQLFEDCKGSDFLKHNEEELLNAIEIKKPNTALDVEIFANEVLINLLDSDIFNEIKQWVYKSPYRKIAVNGEEKKYAVNMNDICFVLSLPLRDKYLEKHPEIKE